MNLVTFWQTQVEKWNTDSKCGLCWDFGAPLIESAVQLQQDTEGKECCVKVFLLRDKATAFSTDRQYNETGLYQATCNKSFQLLVLLPSDMGLNNWNEIKGHGTNESKWATIMYLLEDCLACDAHIDFCTTGDASWRVNSWSAVQVMNYTGSMYCGYRLNVSFSSFAE